MQTKLTLRLDDEVIRHAKAYAKGRGKSISQIVADYLRMLPVADPGEQPARLAPIVSSLRGVLRRPGTTEAADLDEGDYRRHLEDKYL
jgi:3,4-dihydroxy-2-butanone 4-phosphate synthase